MSPHTLCVEHKLTQTTWHMYHMFGGGIVSFPVNSDQTLSRIADFFPGVLEPPIWKNSQLAVGRRNMSACRAPSPSDADNQTPGSALVHFTLVFLEVVMLTPRALQWSGMCVVVVAGGASGSEGNSSESGVGTSLRAHPANRRQATSPAAVSDWVLLLRTLVLSFARSNVRSVRWYTCTYFVFPGTQTSSAPCVRNASCCSSLELRPGPRREVSVRNVSFSLHVTGS